MITIKLPADEMRAMQSILNGERIEGKRGDEVLATYTANFGNGFEADVKVCNGDTPYIDSVLFLDGNEVQVLEPSDRLEGEYPFEHHGQQFIVTIEAVR